MVREMGEDQFQEALGMTKVMHLRAFRRAGGMPKLIKLLERQDKTITKELRFKRINLNEVMKLVNGDDALHDASTEIPSLIPVANSPSLHSRSKLLGMVSHSAPSKTPPSECEKEEFPSDHCDQATMTDAPSPPPPSPSPLKRTSRI